MPLEVINSQINDYSLIQTLQLLVNLSQIFTLKLRIIICNAIMNTW